MKSAQVIIGSGYGDEGKGLATDYYAARYGREALVVRFNGGAQAGHTVASTDGRRHIFSHVGAGSFAGSPTYLSRYFVVNPIVFLDEYTALVGMGVRPQILIDRDAVVTTPYDIMLNQMLETKRGTARHGSCGLGFGETIERQERGGFGLTMRDLADTDRTVKRLRKIRRDYLPRRMAELGLREISEYAGSADVLDRFMDDVSLLRVLCEQVDEAILCDANKLIFEGAQGLQLDMERGAFPHVTRSNTGLRNVIALARGAGIQHLDVSYLTRWYATRHGAGPLPYELRQAPFKGLIDTTNVSNLWQGKLRYGSLNVDGLVSSVLADLGDAGGMHVQHEWLITWADRAPNQLRWVRDGRVHADDIATLARHLGDGTHALRVRLGYGETAAGIRTLSGCDIDAVA